MQDRSNIIKEAIEYRDKLEAKVKSQDEYIASLLLSLFLMQGEIDRLNQTLDLARKGELVYINNSQIVELKAENARLKSCLQEIKEIADAKCNECKYGKDGISCKYGDCGEAKLHLITQLITKAESEGVGMSDKYIIRNCPMYFHGNCYGHTGNCVCQDCTDCVLKQIVEYCLDNDKYGDEYYTRPILKLLDIQEVE